MDDEVRIPANGRSEMRVFVRGEREMAEWLGCVTRLLERAQHQIGENALLGLAGELLREPLIMLRANVEVGAGQRDFHGSRAAMAFAARGPHLPVAYRDSTLRQILDAHGIAKGARKSLKFQNLFRIGLFVNAMEGGDTAVFEIAGDRLVRREHKLLDDPVGEVANAADDSSHASRIVELDYGFRQIEINRSPCRSPHI